MFFAPPTLFSTCAECILGSKLEKSSCRASFWSVKISDLDFADDSVIFAETLDILVGALKALNDESELKVLWISRVKTKIQAFNDILDAVILSLKKKKIFFFDKYVGQ